jgi:4-hydroxy-tetrahydrodipicolinate reductase
MKIALIGYGKMGKAIEKIALERGHNIQLTIDVNNLQDFTAQNLQQCDVAIEFTSPHTAVNNISTILKAKLPIVSGSTGWLANWQQVADVCNETKGSFIYASNFSVGVNIFFALNKKLAALMKNQPNYNVVMEEVHHTEKKDAPSGTAITLAEQVLQIIDRKKQWANHPSTNNEDLEIISKRIDPAPGTHIVKYTSTVDDIEISHTAHNRVGFATGAVLAAEYIVNKKGIFTMSDVLGI